MDRAFFNVPCISKLDELGVNYTIPAIQNERVKRVVGESEPNSVVKYDMKSTSASSHKPNNWPVLQNSGF